MHSTTAEAAFPRTITPLPIKAKQISILTNFYQPIISPELHIHVYAMAFTPEVPYESRSLRIELLTSIEPQLAPLLPSHLLSGINLFSVQEVTAIPPFSPHTKAGDQYSLQLTHVRSVPVKSLEGRQDSQLVLNVVLKRALRALGLLQVTRLPKFYDKRQTVVLQRENVEIWRGYTTELTLRLGNPLVTIDFSSKIVRISTFWEDLQSIYRRNDPTWQLEAKSRYEGRTVMAKYGNNRCYWIDEICFDKHPTDTFTVNGSSITYVEYYRSRYAVGVTAREQPLLRSHIARRGVEWDVYLVPEIVSLTGLDDGQRGDYQFMRKIAETTSLPPDQRLKTSRTLAEQLNSPAALSVLSQFQFRVPVDPLTVNATVFPSDSVFSGHSVSSTGNFSVGERITTPVAIQSCSVLSWLIDDCAKRQFLRKLEDCFRTIGAAFKVTSEDDCDARNFASTVRRVVDGTRPQVVIVLLSKAQRRNYQTIKKTTTTVAVVSTQVVMVPINERRYDEIVMKVALQIQAKVGAQLWVARRTSVFPKYLMVVGLDVFHDTVEKKKSVLGFCATVHPNLSKYYSTTAMHETGQEIATAVGSLFLEAITAFKVTAKRFPETVIFFRDGVSESQVEAVRQFEVQSVLQACQQTMDGAGPYTPNLIYTVVIKKTAAKFYTTTPRATNPAPGTLIVDRVVPCAEDFYLISHYANQGMSAPTLYRTIYASRPDGFPLEDLARLAYRLCHMYYNWSGAIKVPAPCMMAHKIAFLVGQCVHQRTNEAISSSSFYL